MTNTPAFSIRHEVEAFSPYEAGLSIDEIKVKYNLDRVIKLASNENPLGTSAKVIALLQEKAELAFRYPQSGSPRLLSALAKHYAQSNAKIEAKHFVVGNGSDEVIDLLLRVMAKPDSNILAFNPCFSIYRTQAKLCGVELRRAPLDANLHFDLDSLLNLVDGKTVLVFLTNPDNPTGFALEAEKIADFAKKLPANCLLVVDEAYIDFADEKYCSIKYINTVPNIAVLRTFSKCYGLAGLRIGYGIFPEIIADYMRRVRLPFSLNLLAEEAALLALEDKEFYKRTLQTVKEGRAFLTKELESLGCSVYPSQANFILISLPNKENCVENEEAKIKRAKVFFNFLLERGIIIRALSSYSLPSKLRISIGSTEENTLLIESIKEFFAHE